jgi:membrane-bound serine protease (ClpP class)
MAATGLLLPVLSGAGASTGEELANDGATTATTPQPAAATPSPRPGRTIVVPIDSMIDDTMLGSIQRRVDPEIYQEDNAGVRRPDAPTTIIFEIKTWGGAVTSAVDINQYIRNLPEDILTVAFVDDRAISAGAMIAVGCDQIWMVRSSQIGDSAPIRPGQNLEETERAKVESIVLQTFRGSAQENGYPELLSRAMVQVGVEVWVLEQIEPDENGQREIRFATTEEKRELLGEEDGNKDESTLSRLFSTEKDADVEWRLVESLPDPVSGRTFELKQPLDSDTELLTLSQSEAVALGFAQGIASDIESLATALGLALGQIERIDRPTWHRIAAWLNSPLVRGVLFMIMLLGGYLEFQSPGLILPGSVALFAAILFFGAPYAIGFADIWIFVVLAIGIALLAVEIFILPGFGIFGALGIAAILAALVGTFIPPALDDSNGPWLPSLPTDVTRVWDGLKTAVVVLSSGMLASIVGLLLLAKYLPLMSAARHLIPGNPEQVNLEPYDPYHDLAQVGDVGEVVHTLKPAGQVRFGNEIIDVTAVGEFIDIGQKVQVIRRDGMNIVVRPLSQNT